MTNEEKEILKAKYQETKRLYQKARKDIASIPRDSREFYEVAGQLTSLQFTIRDIRDTLLRARFGQFYPTTIIENFMDEKSIGGRR